LYCTESLHKSRLVFGLWGYEEKTAREKENPKMAQTSSSSARHRRRGERWSSSRITRDVPPGLTTSESSSSGGSSIGMDVVVASRKPPHTTTTSDERVMRGAEILRRQIVEDSFQDDEHIMYLHHRLSSNSHARSTMSKESVPLFDDDEGSDWSDPRPPVSGALDSLERNEGRTTNYVSDSSDEEGMVPTVKIQDKRDTHTGYDEVTSEIPVVVPHLDEMENNSLFDTASWSSLLPCIVFDQGILETAAETLVGKRQEINRIADSQPEESPTLGISPAPTTTTLDLLKDLRANEAELLKSEKSQRKRTTEKAKPLPSAERLTSERKRTMEKPNPPPPPPPPPPPAVPLRRQRAAPRAALIFVSRPRFIKGPDPTDLIVAPSSAAYYRLMLDEGHRHALRAGTLWQSIVSQHVRFPIEWWNGSRSPPMGAGSPKKWTFLGRHRVRSNPSLRKLVPSRSDSGRLVLHILIRDIRTGEPVLDIAIGVFHPSANGIRTTPEADPHLGSCRDIWHAMRPRVPDETPAEQLLWSTGQHDYKSPLGPKRAIDNSNLRSVFGERPPVLTVFVLENELYEVLTQPTNQPACAVLLEKYYAGW